MGNTGRTGIAQVILAAAIMVSGAAPAAATGTQPDTLYRLSGLDRQMESVAGQLLAEFDRTVTGLDPDADAILRRLANERFAEAALRPVVLARMTDAWNAGYANMAANWLTSTAGRRITALEAAAGSPQGLAGLDAFAVELLAEPLRPERQALLQALNEAAGSVDFTLDSSLATTLAVLTGVNAVLPTAPQRDPDRLRRELETQRDAMYARTALFLLTYAAYTYRDVSDDELAAYVTFLESPAGNWYVYALLSAATQAQLESAYGFGPAVAAAWRTRDDEPGAD